MPVRVITDSTAALDRNLAESKGIGLVPVRVTIGDRSHRDGEISLGEVVDLAERGLGTSGPPPGDFLEALAGATDGAVIVTVAGALSSTFASARLAAERLPVDVRIVDSGTAAGAQALVALHAAAVARAGGGLDEVEAAARLVASEVRLFGALESLDFLVRGGRVNNVAGAIAGSLGIRPVFELRFGDIRQYRPAFSRQGAIDRLHASWKRSRVVPARLHVVALHAMARVDAEHLLARVSDEIEPATGLVAEFGASMVVHTGPGMVGLAWWWERPR